MEWLETWRAISARIEGLIGAGDLILSSLRVNNSDPGYVVRKFVVPGLVILKEELQRFHDEYAAALPPPAAKSLSVFLGEWRVPVPPNGGQEVPALQGAIPLAVFRSEFDYLIHDTEAEARTLTELAFEHLGRLLVVDHDARKKWNEAFDQRENHCEKLGAVHLLGHGIWAFKMLSAGAATDLVFEEPLENALVNIRRTARALVLTEWKLVQSAGEMERKAEEARKQTELYTRGALADLELKRTRYIVLVSKECLPLPKDMEQANVTYRHIGLPINRDVASKEARRRVT